MAANDLYTQIDMATQVALNYGDTSDITIEKAKKWLNRGLVLINEAGDWSWARVFGEELTTVASQEIYSLTPTSSNTIKKLESVYMSSPIQRRLKMVEDRQFRRLYPNNTATGTPFFYRKAGKDRTAVDTLKIGLYPVPSGVYTIKYDFVSNIPLLVAETDDPRKVCGMPTSLCELLIDIATAIGFRELDDAVYQSAFAEVVERIAQAYRDDYSEIEDSFVMAPMESSDIDKFFDPVLTPYFNE